jgi:hypothetical protein
VARQKGRPVPPLEQFTLQSTGRVVGIRKISTLIRDEVKRQVLRDPAFAQPEPPVFEVDYGTDHKITTANRSHPVYLELLAAWRERFNREVGQRLNRLIIKRGVVCELGPGELAEVTQMRQDLAEIGIDTSGQDDHHIYVAYICIGAEGDYTDLIKALYERSTPTEGAVQAHIDTFRSEVPGQGSVASESGPAT